ncbi:hypothetical protein CHCC14562_2558 [Bacillus licheniformis]|nr:hypothetical protein CHCC14596_2453 [Bacillus licheniformis]TWN20212.1 hypothetical protein CHCC14562_2558 [Bacillus licheniformis]
MSETLQAVIAAAFRAAFLREIVLQAKNKQPCQQAERT